ncbi:di-trans,poly-cis-decaprenylcistransferase [Nautilia lithotrophica]
MHLAIIMDGNGRWAKKRGLKRIEGHKKGAETVRKITEYCAKNEEISILTLYAFSTENWKRPKMEVEFLMKLLDSYLEKELETYIKNDIKFETIGDISKFSDKLKKRIELTKEKTKNNKKLTQVLALNYGSKNEITRAVKKLIEKNEEITEENIQNNLDLPRDVDLLIRTSGEIRLSNFLLWQCAYAEMFFTSTLWPDFTPEELDKIIKSYHLRERRFGGI